MPLRELERLAAVNRFLKLEISKEKEIQEIVELAAAICGTPTALVTLVAEDTQHFKFKVGINIESTGRQEAFCNYAIQQRDVMMVPDTLLDQRFINNPLVIGGPLIRFYAGAPLTTQDGYNLGSLCVIDQKPGKLTDLQQRMLQALSKQVIHLLEFDTSLKILKEQFIEAKSAENILRSFFESSSSCHLLIGKNMEVLAFNKALADFVHRAFGVHIETGMNVSDYIHPSYLPEFTSNYDLALSGTPVQLEREIQYDDRAIFWYFTYDPAFNPQGEIIGVSYNATDITERIAQEKKVLAQNRSLKEIAFIQSHELRRPVSSIIGLMNLLKEDKKLRDIPEIQLMSQAVKELDEKIHMVVGYTSRKPK